MGSLPKNYVVPNRAGGDCAAMKAAAEKELENLLNAMRNVQLESERMQPTSLTDTEPEQFLFDEELKVARHEEMKKTDEELRGDWDENRERRLATLMDLCNQNYQGREFITSINYFFSRVYSVEKIGEGIYGDAYKGMGRTELYPHVYKVVPIAGKEKISGESQRTLDQAILEVLLSM